MLFDKRRLRACCLIKGLKETITRMLFDKKLKGIAARMLFNKKPKKFNSQMLPDLPCQMDQ